MEGKLLFRGTWIAWGSVRGLLS